MTKFDSSEFTRHDSHLLASPASERINGSAPESFCDEVLSILQREDGLTEVVLDLSQVKWISSAGLNELISLQAEARAIGVGVRVQRLCDEIREIFELTRLERSFHLEEPGKTPAEFVR